MYCAVCHKAQLHPRKLQDEWFSHKVDEIQSYTNSHNWKQFYGALKAVYGPQSSGSSPLLSADGFTLLRDKDKTLGRRAEHFNNMLNCPSSISKEAIAHLPQVVINASLADPPTVKEVRRAVNAISTCKATGSDAIPGELYILSRLNLISKLTELLKSAWTFAAIPQEFKDATIVHLYKRKGNWQCCDSHQGISILLTARKVLSYPLLNCPVAHLELGLLPEIPCGFWEGCSTEDMVFAAQQLQEKCQEQNQDLYSSFINLTKAFETVTMVSGKSCQSLAIHLSSSPWYIHSIMGCLHESSTMASHLMPSLSQMESNKDVCWPQHCSAYCLLLCYWMHFQTMRTPSNYASTLMGICSI